MVKQLFVAVIRENEIGVVYGKGTLRIEVSGDDNFVNFRIVASSDKENYVSLKIDESYNKSDEHLKCVNFITKWK